MHYNAHTHILTHTHTYAYTLIHTHTYIYHISIIPSPNDTKRLKITKSIWWSSRSKPPRPLLKMIWEKCVQKESRRSDNGTNKRQISSIINFSGEWNKPTIDDRQHQLCMLCVCRVCRMCIGSTPRIPKRSTCYTWSIWAFASVFGSVICA